MSRLGFGPSNLRFALACLGVAVGLSAPLGSNLRSEVLLADEAADPSARTQRAEDVAARPAAADQLAESDGSLSEAELRRSIREIGYLSTFFGRLAAYEAAAERRSYWEDLRLGYAAAAGRLGRLLDQGGLTLADLPAGRRGSLGEAGIVIDTTLDGAWQPEQLRRERAAGEDDWRHSHRLSAAIFEGLAGLEGYERWIWFDSHLKRSPTAGTLEPGREAVAGPLLTRYWFAKDWHLWASVAAKAADERRLRTLWTTRRDALAAQAERAVEETRAKLGTAWHAALAANWQQHVATAEEIAATFAGVGAMAGFFPEARGEAVEAEPEATPKPRDPTRREEITALRGRLAELEGRIGQLGGQLRQSRDEASRLERELGAARDLAGAREAEDDRLTRAYAELEAAQLADQQRLAELEAERKASLDRVAELEAARAADQSRVAQLELRLAALREELSASLEQSSAIEGALSETQRDAGSIGSEQDKLRQLMQTQGRQIAAERRRVAELEQRLSTMVAQLEESRGEIDRYQAQIQENQGELSRYRDEMRATGEELSRYREELDAAQDRQSESMLSLARAFGTGQTAVIVLGVVLLLLSVMTIAVLLRRTAAAGATAPVAPARDRGGQAAANGRTATRNRTPSATPSRTAEPDRAESEALAARKDAPRDRLLALAGERIEVAIPILVRSEALTDADLIGIIRRTTTRHRLAIAMRPTLSRGVVDALVATGDAKVAAAVLQNDAAEITPEAFGRLAEQAAAAPALKAALLERPGLPAALRDRLEDAAKPSETATAADATVAKEERGLPETEVPSPAAEAPQQDLAAKLQAAAAKLDAAAVEEAAARDRKATEAEPETRSPAAADATEEDAPSAPAASGEVAPHALIEALRQGKLELFEALFGKMTGLRPPRLQQVIYGAGGENLAIACRALGLGKPLMTSIFIWSRKGRADLGVVNPRELSQAMTVFDETSPEAAQDMIAAWIEGDAIPGEWDRRLHGPAAE